MGGKERGRDDEREMMVAMIGKRERGRVGVEVGPSNFFSFRFFFRDLLKRVRWTMGIRSIKWVSKVYRKK